MDSPTFQVTNILNNNNLYITCTAKQSIERNIARMLPTADVINYYKKIF